MWYTKGIPCETGPVIYNVVYKGNTMLDWPSDFNAIRVASKVMYYLEVTGRYTAGSG